MKCNYCENLDEMEGKQQKKAKTSKHEIRNPEKEFEQVKHKSPLGFEGFPAVGFKAAMVRGAKSIGLVMTDMRTSMFVKADCNESQIVKIEGESRLRRDAGRLPNGSGSIIYRAEYPKWKATLNIEYNAGIISSEQVVQMVRAAGYGVGVGDWRPEKSGVYGRFDIVV